MANNPSYHKRQDYLHEAWIKLQQATIFLKEAGESARAERAHQLSKEARQLRDGTEAARG